MDGYMAVRTYRAGIESGFTKGGEAQMELRYERMTAETQFTHILVGQQVAVRTAVRCMTRRAAVDSRCGMLEDERSVLCCVTFAAPSVSRTAKPGLQRRTMRIVTRRAGQRVLAQAMTLCETEFSQDFFMTACAGLGHRIYVLEAGRRKGLGVPRPGFVNGVAIVTGQPRRFVRADSARMRIAMATGARRGPYRSWLFVKAEDAAARRIGRVLRARTVTAFTILAKRRVDITGGIFSVTSRTAYVLREGNLKNRQ